MAKVKPFKGLRPPKELIEVVASRPYDVLSSEEARQECEGSPCRSVELNNPTNAPKWSPKYAHAKLTQYLQLTLQNGREWTIAFRQPPQHAFLKPQFAEYSCLCS